MSLTNPFPIARRKLVAMLGLGTAWGALALNGRAGAVGASRYALSDAEWQRRLPPAAFAVLRRAATERPYTSALLNEHRQGKFACAGCDLPLFASSTKFDSGTGWPSFWKPLPGAVQEKTDFEIGYARTEVHCARCAGHLGHVFGDGPAPTHLRYCMNGVAMTFHPGA